MYNSVFIAVVLVLLSLREYLEEEIPLLIKDGNADAFRVFFEKYFDRLILFITARGASEAVAEDIIQNAFLYIWENRGRIDTDKSLKSYLYKIAYTKLLNHVAFQKRFTEETELEGNFAGPEPEDDLKVKELNERLESVISSMPPKRKAVFELCFMQEFSYKEAAELLEVSVNTIENHMVKAFKEVRKGLKDFVQ